MKEIELQKLRKKREKHFLQQNGNIIAKIYDDDVHFFKNGKYEEIDNTLISIQNGYINKENDYHVSFYNNQNYLMKMEKEQFFLNIKLENINSSILLKENEDIYYKNILNDVDLKYQVKSNKVKEEIILKNNPSTDKLSFIIETNLNLKLQNKEIYALDGENIVFSIDAPFMYDSNGKFNDNLYYLLNMVSKNVYNLDLYLDNIWLNGEDISYPVIIDPTITNRGEENNVYDTYIYPGDTNVNRNNQDILKVGVERINGVDRINRALIKFELPEIETGSQVIEALMTLVGYPVLNYNYQTDTVTVHRITTDWEETSANWDLMHDKYDDTYVEGGFVASRSNMDSSGNVTGYSNICDITKLVKRWYTDVPNYGLMLKANNEVYKNNIIPSFFSKNNTATGHNPKPILRITYRNHNGLEKYLNYKAQSFTRGNSYVNTYNGNLIASFNVGATIGGKLPVNLNMFYNTNDVLLESDYGYGYGYKLNFNQLIEEHHVDENNYLKYVDEDGTNHYFYLDNDIFKDEDGLELTIIKINNEYILKDTHNNQKKFMIVEGIGYLKEIIDVIGNKITIQYDEFNRIIKIIDGNSQEINIVYGNNRISIVSPDQIIYLNYTDSKINSIETITGNTLFSYNDNNIIESITDENLKKIKYEYYNQIPYRVKKLTEYGIDDTIGKFFDIIYDNDSTSIVENNNKTTSIVFNDYGNPVSISYLKSKGDIKEAYGNFENYGNYDQYLNEVASNGVPIKYVENYLKNTSFENSDTEFRVIGNLDSCVVEDDSYTGLKSLKAVKNNANNFLNQIVDVEKGEHYTFSCYLKNDCVMRLALSYINGNNEIVEEKSEKIKSNSDFERFDVTIFYPDDAISALEIKIYCESSGTAYIEDVQLEKGEVANDYNLLDNSDFSCGYDEWTLTAYDSNGPGLSTNGKFEIVTLDNGNKALKIKMNLDFSTTLTKTFDIKGKAGDAYFLTFWYKNEGVPTYPFDTASVVVKYNFVDQTTGTCFTPPKLNCNKDNWQFFSYVFIASKDFKSLTVEFTQGNNANNLYITNLNLFRDARYNQYEYDEYGNIIGFKGFNNNQTTFNYDKNNQLIKMTTPKGGKFKFEYDNFKTDRILNQVSATGITNQIKYNEYGNPILTRVANIGQNNEIMNGLYKFRLKGTNKYLKFRESSLIFEESNCNHDLWLLEKIEDKYKIKHSILEKYLTIVNNKIILTTGNSLFNFIENDDGSYVIKGIDNQCFYNDNNVLNLKEYVDDDYNYDFYLEGMDNDLFIENNAEFTDDGRFVKSITDALLNKKIYDVDLVTGAVNSVTNSKGQITNYEYNDKRQLIKVSNGSKNINYTYDSNNKLSKIVEGNKEYNFEYDKFLNNKSVKIGDDIILITNNYEQNNGNLLSVNYGNNHTISFEYDEFNRPKVINTMNDTYNYKYNNNGNLAKIVSAIGTNKYIYDLAKRLQQYILNDFKIKYQYDENDNVASKEFDLNDNSFKVVNKFNDDNYLVQILADDVMIDYVYDYLGRLITKKINDSYNVNYEYVTNGKRTSLIIKSIKNNNNLYSYKYDKLNNITHTYYNNNLINRYYYDEYNELIEEHNYNRNETIKYVYDNYGNIVSKKIYKLNTETLLSENNYEYNNSNWLDQLTKFNNQSITYDEIGNPLTIGDKTLTWINGRQLNSYVDSNKSIEYLYDEKGVRISKTINGICTTYYLENSNVIIEKTGENVLYFIRDNFSSLIGFKYNNTLYYYIKNAQDDIIGILDSNYNQIVAYNYDSWGNIVSITDGEGNDISSDMNHIGNINPYRYRSYYYDKEIGLYYLNTRYYNPIWGRFINADGILGTNQDMFSHNLYIYCGNNPINIYDPNGQIGIFIGCLIIFMAGSIAAGSVISAAKQTAKTGKVDFKKVVKDSLGGITLEAGIGFGYSETVGFGISKLGGEAQAGGYQDFNVGLSNGEFFSSTTAEIGISTEIYGVEIGRNYGYTHYRHPVTYENFMHDSPVTMYWDVWDCEHTTLYEGTSAKRSNKTFEITNNESFIGITYEKHIGLGGHIKIGYTFD